jgi:hypothetical protein
LARRRVPFTCEKNYVTKCVIYLVVSDGSHILARSLYLCLCCTSKWLLSPCFPSQTHHETRVFTTGSLNNTPSPSPNSKTITFGATTPRPSASRNFSPTISTSSLARLHLPNGIQTVTVILSMTPLYCLRLSRCFMTRRQTTHHPKPVLTSKTRLVDFYAK